MRRFSRLVVLAPELRPLGAALLGVWACACRSALGAGGVVLLVGPVGSGPVGRGHETSNRCLFARAAMPKSTSLNSGGVVLRMRVLSLPPTMAIIPMRRAFS